MAAHYFKAGGACVWCKASPEKVADRRAPPFCTEAPEEMREREFVKSRYTANGSTGY